jgi:acyl-CoA reductase-like NAD-dependent aldehyde dehydrogenase
MADGMRIAQKEIFRSIISALPFDTIEEVIERADRTLRTDPRRLDAGCRQGA